MKAKLIEGLITMAVFAAIVFAINAAIEHFRQQGYDRGYDKATQEYTARDNETLKAQLVEIARLNGKLKEAEAHVQAIQEANRKLSARNAELLGSMRDTDTAINAAVGSATAAALADATRALVPLFGECRGAYEEMGRAAAGHLADVKKLSESWPN